MSRFPLESFDLCIALIGVAFLVLWATGVIA